MQAISSGSESEQEEFEKQQEIEAFNNNVDELIYTENQYYQKLDHFYRYFFRNMEFSNLESVQAVANTISVVV